MRLSDVLSKPLTSKFVQIDGFIGTTKLSCGNHRKIDVGIVALTYFCCQCEADITFISDKDLSCMGINDNLISIDCVLKCPRCGAVVPVWFIVEGRESIYEQAPRVRVLKRTERLTEDILLSQRKYPQYAEWLEKADQAYRSELGAGALVYLRKILEDITMCTAKTLGIETKTRSGKHKPFKEILEKVEGISPIIPREFSENGYKLFGELSDVIHGDYDEQQGLKKYDALHRLVIGILDNVKNKEELQQAKETLGWDEKEEVLV